MHAKESDPFSSVGDDSTNVDSEELEDHVAATLSLAATKSEGPVTASDALDALVRIKHNSKAFENFRSILQSIGPVNLPEPDVEPDPISPIQLFAGFSEALEITRATVRNRPKIWGRDLITAILFMPGPLEAEFTKDLAPDWIARVQSLWQKFLANDDPKHFEKWTETINALQQLRVVESAEPTETADLQSGESNWLARYSADVGADEDKLGIERDVNAMASVIASEDIDPPLAIGLFGNWGSGKTFFMEKLDSAVQIRADAVQRARMNGEVGRLPYVSRIVPIWFNAWHYMDANLWPSLVVRIFDGLAEYTKGEDEELDDARSRLLEESEVTKLELNAARREHESIKNALGEEKERIGKLASKREKYEQDVSDLDPWDAVSTPQVLSIIDRAAGDLDVKIAGENVSLEQQYNAVSEAASELRGLWSTLIRLSRGESSKTRLKKGVRICLAAGAVLGLSIFGLMTWLQIDFSELWAAAAAVFPVLAWLTSKLKAAGETARKINAELTGIEDDLAEAENEQRRKSDSASRRVEQLVHQEDLAQRRILELEAAHLAAEKRVEDATTGRMLERFVQERSRSDDYRQNLGVISMIREDFERFALLFARNKADGGNGEDPKFERIVLFIDDLDRCPRKRVVEVLQAVHLLLALDLFVVVVAVDPRWLQDSLENAKSLVLHIDPEASADSDMATPLNYLEKIFQIPYTLRPMQSSGFSDYVKYLTGKRKTGDQERTAGNGRMVDGSGPVDAVTGPAGADRPEQIDPDRAITDGAAPDNTVGDDGIPASDTPDAGSDRRHASTADNSGDDSDDTGSNEERARLLRTRSVELSEIEREYLSRLGPPIIRTPRQAKRLVNCFQFLRATFTEDELLEFTSKEQPKFAACLLLLALATGQPEVASQVLDRIDEQADDLSKDYGYSWGPLKSVLEDVSPDLVDWYRSIASPLEHVPPPQLLSAAQLVRKFSFVIVNASNGDMGQDVPPGPD